MQIIERAGGELLIARLPTAEDIADAIINPPGNITWSDTYREELQRQLCGVKGAPMYVYLKRVTFDGWVELARVPRRDYESPTVRALIDPDWTEIDVEEFDELVEGVWPSQPVATGRGAAKRNWTRAKVSDRGNYD